MGCQDHLPTLSRERAGFCCLAHAKLDKALASFDQVSRVFQQNGPKTVWLPFTRHLHQYAINMPLRAGSTNRLRSGVKFQIDLLTLELAI